MVRLRNSANGVVVNVDDATASRLGAAFVSTEAGAELPPVEAKPKRAVGRPKKSE